MEIFMRNIPYTIGQFELTRIIAQILHKDPYFASYSVGAPLNFYIFLFPDKKRRLNVHSGTGALTLPEVKIGEAFLRHFIFTGIITSYGNIVVQKSRKEPREDILGEIRLMPYRDPEIVRAEEERLEHLNQTVRLEDVQFAWLCRDDTISIEWQWNNLVDAGVPYESFNLQFGDTTRETIIKSFRSFNWEYFNEVTFDETIFLKIRYSSIQAIEIDSATNIIQFSLSTPPSLERERIPREIFWDSPPKRDKLCHLGGTHKLMAPFTWTVLRLICQSPSDLVNFKRMADLVNLNYQKRPRTATRQERFSPQRIERLQSWLRKIDYFVAFQCESLHKDLLLDTQELLALKPQIESLIFEYGAKKTTNILHQFGLGLRNLWYLEENETVDTCFTQAIEDTQQVGPYHTSIKDHDDHLFDCLHVTFTPTRMGLRGPFPDTSNRILRRYSKHPEAFLRVSFTDEDGLKFRFDHREVAGADFIHERVGTILKEGFSLCGRPFEFLAYSQSALKQYTVWFCSPFTDESGRKITAQSIRDGIGSNWSQELMRCPARFAARLSQAFTAINLSIMIEPDQIERGKDIERNGYCFSDGNGLASPLMFEAIQNARQKGIKTKKSKRTTSVVQVRIQGAKGVISEAPHLDGFQLVLRDSMVKFEAEHEHAVEMARFFDKPINFFLNRPLVMILAGLGVPDDVFLGLQRNAIKEANDAATSLQGAARLLETHGMGTAFVLPSVLLNLKALGLDINSNKTSAIYFNDPFLNRCLRFAVHHVLREIKHRARVPIPQSWKLVGIVDEYNILKPRQIYACVVRGEGGNREYIKGQIMISKSPTIHPGDVQIVEAIGKPAAGCLLHELVNCVVFSQQGDRPLPNMLSGSDLDGDEYDLVALKSLHPSNTCNPGQYSAVERHTLDRPSTIQDVADFVVNFINNDMLGIVSTNFLLIADLRGIFHPDCQTLAELHSWAVDFPKNGVPVPLQQIPTPGIRIKPDWYAPEITVGREANYYESESILGKMFRDIELPTLPALIKESRKRQRRNKRSKDLTLEELFEDLSLENPKYNDPISKLLLLKLDSLVNLKHDKETTLAISDLFDYFAAELEHICYAYTLYFRSNSSLREEEVFIGTIIANTTQPRLRRDNIASMRDESTALTKRILKELEGDENSPICDIVNRSWTAWRISVRKGDVFGAKSFGFVALRAIFDEIKTLENEY